MSLEMVSESHYICPQGSLTQQQQETALTYPPLSFHSACETQANTSKTLAFPYCSTRNTYFQSLHRTRQLTTMPRIKKTARMSTGGTPVPARVSYPLYISQSLFNILTHEQRRQHLKVMSRSQETSWWATEKDTHPERFFIYEGKEQYDINAVDNKVVVSYHYHITITPLTNECVQNSGTSFVSITNGGKGITHLIRQLKQR